MTSAPIPAAELDGITRALGARYAIERELGRGGMGTVYLARDLRLDRPVALKVLPAEFASQVALRDRFLRETRTAASFSHPNIVPVYAVEEGDNLLAYAMGLVDGETLAERVARAGPLPVREIVRVLQDVGYALAYAHGRGVVHRDIKPDNVMIERATGRALVMDFGISRSMTHAMPSAALTRVGEVVGTPEYMSPEQASGDVVDGRSDLYSLGLTAHFAASGQVAVTGETTQKILVKQLTERVTPVAEVRADLPPALAEAIDCCVAKDPAERFATAEALVEAIDAAQLAEPEIPVPVRLFAGEVGILSLMTIGIVGFSWLLWNSSNASTIDNLLPIVLLVAVLVTRSMTTLSEARRLALAGFAPEDITKGFARVMAERAERRAELRADADTRRRRRITLVMAALMLVMSIVMIVTAYRMRIPVGNGSYTNTYAGLTLVFSGAALLGTSLVLLAKSPFRMPPGERLFRLVWLGPIGRAFVRFGARGVTRTAGPRIRSRGSMAAVVVAPPRSARPVAAPPAGDRMSQLEGRVAALERWREQANK
jgi:serine/threonine-protein kinase